MNNNSITNTNTNNTINILSIDVGIKNLALCLFSIHKGDKQKYEIAKWDVLNLCKEDNFMCTNIACNKKALYCKHDSFFCKKHTSDTSYNILPSPLEAKNIKNVKVDELKKRFIEYDIPFEKKNSKIILLELLETEIANKYLEIANKAKKASDFDLIQIGIHLTDILDDYLQENTVDVVLIENQISPLASRMKTLQGMLAQYFIIRKTHNIKFISAANKLKYFMHKSSTTYNERKKFGIEITQQILSDNIQFHPYENYLYKNKKKDDLADCFLQGMWYLTEAKLVDYIY